MARPAQSKATHELNGTRRKDRHGTGDLPPSAPACPTWLSREAKAEWQRIVPTLTEKVGLHKIDRGLLAAYCATWAEYQNAVTTLSKVGEWYEAKTKNGVIRRLHPLVQIRNAARDSLIKFGSQLGLSPSARARLNIAGGSGKDDKKKRFLS